MTPDIQEASKTPTCSFQHVACCSAWGWESIHFFVVYDSKFGQFINYIDVKVVGRWNIKVHGKIK